jgi:hypothetical protein
LHVCQCRGIATLISQSKKQLKQITMPHKPPMQKHLQMKYFSNLISNKRLSAKKVFSLFTHFTLSVVLIIW